LTTVNPYQAPQSPDAAAQPERPRLPRNVLLLGLTSLLNDVASEMLFPLLPAFLLSLPGGSKTYLGLMDGVADTVSSLLKLWSGAHSDAAGKRKGFIIFGYGLAAIARPLMALAAAPWHLVALRSLDRVGKGIRAAPRDALIAESTEEGSRGRAFGFHRAMDHLGAAIGPLLATGFLLVWPDHWRIAGFDQLRLLFLLSLLPAIPILLVVLFGIREQPRQAGAETKSTFALSLAPFGFRFRLFLVALLVFTLGNSSDSFLLVRAGELGVPTAWLPILWCVFHFAKSWLTNATGPWIDRTGPRPLIWAGWLIYAATYLAFALAFRAWQVWALFLVYAVFYALTEPAEKALVAELVGAENRGLAYGWYNLTIGIGALPASLVFGVIYQQFGPLAAFGMGAALALAAAVLLIGVRSAKEQ
jgi:MFS family permease